jgi:hypothetical protein
MIKHLLFILKSIFVVVLLADTANITDLLPTVTTIHVEEVEVVLANECVGQSSNALPQTLPASTSVGYARSSQVQRRVLLDKDSPSLPPDLTSTTIAALRCAAEEAHTGSDVFGHLRLYLWDDSFLFRI